MFELTPATLALASLPHGVVLCDRQERITFINGAAARLLELDRNQWLQRPLLDLCSQYQIPAYQIPAKGKCVVTHNEHAFFVQALPLPPEAEQADVGCALLLSANVEEVRLANDLIAMLAHELRTPLTVIQGYAELLQREVVCPLHDGQREFVETIRQRSIDLMQIISQSMCLAYLRTLEGKAPYELVEVTKLAETVVQQVTFQHRGQRIDVAAVLPSEPLHVRTNEDMLRFTLLQILDNAVRYTPPEGHIEIALAREAHEVIISIRDTGVGFPEDQRAHIFKPFTQIHDPRLPYRSSLGIGLAIVRECMDHNNATVTFESVEGAGTTFRIAVPVDIS